MFLPRINDMVFRAFLALFSVFIFSFFFRRNRIFLPTLLIQSALKSIENIKPNCIWVKYSLILLEGGGGHYKTGIFVLLKQCNYDANTGSLRRMALIAPSRYNKG